MAGGEEDGVNNEDANPEDLYSTPEAPTWRLMKAATIWISVVRQFVWQKCSEKLFKKLPDVD